MKLGIFSFNTDYTIRAHELAIAAEERGFESVDRAALDGWLRRAHRQIGEAAAKSMLLPALKGAES